MEGWEITNPFFATRLTSAAQGLLLTEALLFSLTPSQVLSYVPGCKIYEKKIRKSIRTQTWKVCMEGSLYLCTLLPLPRNEVHCSEQAVAG